MHSDRDTTRIVRSWLEEGVSALPDRVLDAVLDQVPATRQRRSPWPARRFADMNSYAKLAIMAAAVVVVALVGHNLLPAGGGNVGVTPTVSPSSSPSFSPTPVPSPSPSELAFLPTGPIEAGRHPMIRSGKSLSVDLPSGWFSNGDFRIYTASGQGAFIFWSDPPTNVYADPCSKEPLDPPAGDTPADLAAAVASIPGTDLVIGPSDVTIGGHPAKLVTIRVRDDIGCPPDQFMLWYQQDPAEGRWPDAVGDTMTVWIIDADGTIVWIDGTAARGTTPALQDTMRQLVESIRFE